MPVRFQLVIDGADPDRLARFWAAALGYELAPAHPVPDAKTVKNRLHLDVHASGEWTDPIEAHRKRVDAEASRLAGRGATSTGALTEEGLDHYAVGTKDPEGNDFDIN